MTTGPRHQHDMAGWNSYFWANWNHVKHTPLAHQAAREGWALMLKSALLAGVPIANIEPQAMAKRVERAARLAGIVEADENFPQRETALALWKGVLVDGAKAEDEIARATGFTPHPPTIPPFDYPHRIAFMDNPPEHLLRRAYG